MVLVDAPIQHHEREVVIQVHLEMVRQPVPIDRGHGAGIKEPRSGKPEVIESQFGSH